MTAETLRSTPAGIALLVLMIALSGCGSDAPGYHLELTDAAMALDEGDVILSVPWSARLVSRDPTPDTPPAVVRGLGFASADGVDRIVFEFIDTNLFPGYRVMLSDTLPQRCGAQPGPIEMPGSRYLVIDVEPAVLQGDVPAQVTGPVEDMDLPHMKRGVLACAADGRFLWAVGLEGEVSGVRVRELRKPARLSVEVR